MGKPKLMTIQMTRDQALMLGILKCDCGHPPNNHFPISTNVLGSCAHCKCKCYEERVVLPQVRR